MTLVLASRSPQRRAILEQLGISFLERPTDVEEEEAGDPEAIAAGNALRKAQAATPQEGEVVLGVDTVVAADGRLWGKPADPPAAAQTLRALSGRTHRVVSGLALLRAGHEAQAATAKSPRIEPGEASSGFVAPITWRAEGTACSPSSTIATSGPEVMKETSSPKNGLPSCSA